MNVKSFFVGVAVAFVLAVAAVGGAVTDRVWGLPILDKLADRTTHASGQNTVFGQKILTEENAVIDVVEHVSGSVVTVSIKKTQTLRSPFSFSPFQRNLEQDIGSGFILSTDGLIVTNKHVVSDTEATYKVVTADNKTYDVQKIYRDPTNDLAILKLDARDLKPLEMGDSSKLKVGQSVVAIGTALGEFRQTVTTGVVSGLGRGITAGSPFEGAERLDDVIQTDAAINPGNSGGPLLNSAGQVIGVNTAVSAEGQNIGFAIPINIIKEAIDNFNKTGQFSRPYLGVQYRMIDQKTALLNDVPQGAYVQRIVEGSPAEKAGIQEGDILTKIGGTKLGSDEAELASEIGRHKVGDVVEVEYWRDGQTKTVRATFEEAK